MRFRPIEGALEVSLIAVGLVLLIVGWTNYSATITVNCVRISCPNFYDFRYRLMFFAGIIVTIVASAGLTWNFLSHARRQSATVGPAYSNFEEDAV